jgi:6-pyruvoyltetrahydropterin/6-carboxytetrahydropterin synthase
MGWVTDYADIKAALAPSYHLLDHRELDQVEGIGADASAAAITQWLRDRLEPGLPYLARIDLFEAPGCGVIRSLAGSGEGSRHASVIVPG